VLDSKPVLNRAFQLLLITAFAASSCGGARISHNEIRRKVAELGTSTLVPQAVEIRRIVNESDKRVIAETTVELAAQFERDTVGSPWHITSVRLGDQNWISVAELTAVINELRGKDTAAALRKLDAGVTAFRQRNGNAPTASTITALTDILHPQFMSELVLADGWGRPIEIAAVSPAYRFRSVGPDGRSGTPDDILFP
jgi:hypothetical protein